MSRRRIVDLWRRRGKGGARAFHYWDLKYVFVLGEVPKEREKAMKLVSLYSKLHEIHDGIGMKCKRPGGCDGECCRPSEGAGQPSVTQPEIALINDYLASHEPFLFSACEPASCKFLDLSGKCSIYPVRPIDCRVHFCADAAMGSADNEEVASLVCEYHSQRPLQFRASALLSDVSFYGEPR